MTDNSEFHAILMTEQWQNHMKADIDFSNFTSAGELLIRDFTTAWLEADRAIFVVLVSR